MLEEQVKLNEDLKNGLVKQQIYFNQSIIEMILKAEKARWCILLRQEVRFQNRINL